MKRKRSKQIKCICMADLYTTVNTYLDGQFEVSFDKDKWYKADDLGLSYRVYDNHGNSLVFSVLDNTEYVFDDFFKSFYDIKKLVEVEEYI